MVGATIGEGKPFVFARREQSVCQRSCRCECWCGLEALMHRQPHEDHPYTVVHQPIDLAGDQARVHLDLRGNADINLPSLRSHTPSTTHDPLV